MDGRGGERKAAPWPKGWISSGPLILPDAGARRGVVAVKDPSVFRHGGAWQVYATIATPDKRWSIASLGFADWDAAGEARWSYLDIVPGFTGYAAAPQVFRNSRDGLWYLVFQAGPPMYSTCKDPSGLRGWSRPKPFFAGTPRIIEERDGSWLDFWAVSDGDEFHLFFSDDQGRLYRASTKAFEFPRGFGDPEIVMEDAEPGRLFEACNVYRASGRDEWLLLVEAYDASSSSRRYFRSWTARSLSGPWNIRNDDARDPFIGLANVAFPPGSAWTKDLSHGEALREDPDEAMRIDPASMSFLYQGYDPADPVDPAKDYIAIPWRLGLLRPMAGRADTRRSEKDERA